ncbi:MAG: KpsF/GutQ family sugar-phosphate isomerase [Cetobacterium sp.]|uniref:KpsF/GutQ family sugar-phosphate isomerase n=1 Tax=Cetobacterium sp. TaxID=2071632 RepID=UPI003F2BD02D
MNKNQILSEIIRVFDIEIKALELLKESLNNDIEKICLELIGCEGKVIITGMGKSGHIGKKMSATFSSLGTPSFFLHPAEALHGDLGMVTNKDIVIAISYSGESQEVIDILQNLKIIGSKIIAITGNEKSTLGQKSDYIIKFPKIQEACSLDLAPTSSTTCSIVLGDALAVAISKMKDFKKNDFALFHPAGSLGKTLLTKVQDIMFDKENHAEVSDKVTVQDAIMEMCKKQLSLVNIIDENRYLLGVITDGDLRRIVSKNNDIYLLNIKKILNTTPSCINSKELAVDALKLMNEKGITSLPVLDDKKAVVGTIRMQEILNTGIYNSEK